jgi:hypothetical protein
MKPKDKGGVVDAQLNVYGVTALKVAGKRLNKHLHSSLRIGSLDLSICPTNVGNVRASTHHGWSCLSMLTGFFSFPEHILHCIVDRREGGSHYCAGLEPTP